IDSVNGEGYPHILRILFTKISHGGAKDGADDARDDDHAKQLTVDVPEAVVTVAGDAAGEYPCRMHAAADDGGAYPVSEEEGGRDRAIAKPHRAVDHLCEEAGEGHDEKALDVELFGQAAE